LGFATALLGIFLIFAMVWKHDIVIVESVGGVDDELARDTSIDLIISNLDVESIHLQCDKDLLENDELYLATIEVQV
jgi:hypothetical protein